MAAAESNNIEEILTPFYQRATEAEERLARLEASLSENKDQSENEEQTKLISELQIELENVKAEQVAERKKAMEEMKDLTAENGKLKYQIIHLVRALHEADEKLATNDLVNKTQQLDHVPSVKSESRFDVPEAR